MLKNIFFLLEFRTAVIELYADFAVAAAAAPAGYK